MVVLKLPHISAGSTSTQRVLEDQTLQDIDARQHDPAKPSSPGSTPRFKRKREANTPFRKRRLPRINISSHKREPPTKIVPLVIGPSHKKLKLTTILPEHAFSEHDHLAFAPDTTGEGMKPVALHTHSAPSSPPRNYQPRTRLASEGSHHPEYGIGLSTALTRDRSRGILEALPGFSTGKPSKVGSLGRDMTAESSEAACSATSYDLPSARPRGTMTLRREARAQDLPKWRHLIAVANEENGDGDLYLLSKYPQAFESPHTFYARRQQQRREKYWLGDCEDDSFEGPVYPDPRHDRPFWIPQTPASKGLPVPLRRGRHKRPASIYFEEITEQDLPLQATPVFSKGGGRWSDRTKTTHCPRRSLDSPTSPADPRHELRPESGVQPASSHTTESLKVASDSSPSVSNDRGSCTPCTTPSEGRFSGIRTPAGRVRKREASIPQWTQKLQQSAAIKVSPWLKHSTPQDSNGVSNSSGTLTPRALHTGFEHNREGSEFAHCERSDADCHSEALKTTPSLSSFDDFQEFDPSCGEERQDGLSFACRGLQAEETVHLSPCSRDLKGLTGRSVEDSSCADDAFLAELAERSEAWSQRMNWRPRPLMLRPEKQSSSSDQIRLFLGRHRLSTASYRPPGVGMLPTSSSLPIFGAVTPRKGILNRNGLQSCAHSRDVSTNSCVSHVSIPELQRNGPRELVLPSMIRQRQDV